MGVIGSIPAAQRTLAAIVFTDAVDFSLRTEQDEECTVALIQQDLELMAELCRRFDGRVVKSRGDGLMMLFNSAVQAVTCALEIQKSLAIQAKEATEVEALRHRIGVHLGDVLVSDGDALGEGVNVAARLEAEADPGGICLSQTVYDVVKGRVFLQAVKVGDLKLKNIGEPVTAYKVAGVGRVRKHHSFRPHWATLAALGVALLLFGASGMAFYMSHQQPKVIVTPAPNPPIVGEEPRDDLALLGLDSLAKGFDQAYQRANGGRKRSLRGRPKTRLPSGDVMNLKSWSLDFAKTMPASTFMIDPAKLKKLEETAAAYSLKGNGAANGKPFVPDTAQASQIVKIAPSGAPPKAVGGDFTGGFGTESGN